MNHVEDDHLCFTNSVSQWGLIKVGDDRGDRRI